MHFSSQPERFQPRAKAAGFGAWALRYGLVALLVGIAVAVWAEDPPEAPVSGMVPVASFEAGNCVPYRMMVPLREDL